MSNTDDPDRIRPATALLPVHPSITAEQIDAMVEAFYRQIWADDRLGPIFAAHISDRAKHLQTMKDFWSSVLLKTPSYRGRPVPAHMRLTEAVETDFPRWLAFFGDAAREAFDPDAAPLVIAAAERIARSLWMAMFAGPTSRAE
jgi:hemoglobin